MADTVEVTMRGVDEVVESLKDLARRYPDSAGNALRKEARVLRGRITQKASARLNSDGTSKVSLKKDTSYSVSQPKGYSEGQYVDLSAKSPHFHLVERGHRVTNKQGRVLGHAEGRYFMKDAVDEYEPEFEEAAERMLDDLLKREGLI